MTEQELISAVIDEITEHKLSHYRIKNKEYKAFNTELTQLGSKVQSVLSELSASKADIINLYIAKHAALADKGECEKKSVKMIPSMIEYK